MKPFRFAHGLAQFQINGFTVSMGNRPTHYCENRSLDMSSLMQTTVGAHEISESDNIEIAIFKEDGNWATIPVLEKAGIAVYDDVYGYCTVEELGKIINTLINWEV